MAGEPGAESQAAAGDDDDRAESRASNWSRLMARPAALPMRISTAAALAEAIQAIPGLDRSRLLLFGGWESAIARRRRDAAD